MTRIVICDDHRVFAQALAVVLESPTTEVVRSVTDPRQAAAAVVEHAADVLVMDIHYPGGSGLGYVEEVRRLAPDCRIVILSAYDDPSTISDAVVCGADAYAAKTDNLTRIVDVVHGASNGYTTPSVRVEMDRARRSRRTEDPFPGQFLTDREHEVLTRLAHGQDTRTMAREMGVAYSTARTHIQNLISKLGVHSRLEAVAYAVRYELVDLDEPLERDVG